MKLTPVDYVLRDDSRGSAADKDLELVAKVLDRGDLSDEIRAAFEDMQVKAAKWPLSKKQRTWAKAILAGEKYEPDIACLNLWSNGLVPKGRDVPDPPMLRRENLPMKPPRRPQ